MPGPNSSVWFISPYKCGDVWWHLQDSEALQLPQLSVSLYLEAPGDTGPSYDVIPTCTCYWAQLHVTWGQAVFHAIDTLAIMLRDGPAVPRAAHSPAQPSFWYYLMFHAVGWSWEWPRSPAHSDLTPVWAATPDPQVALKANVSFSVLSGKTNTARGERGGQVHEGRKYG